MTPLEVSLLVVATIEGIFMTAAFVAVFMVIRDSEHDLTMNKVAIGLVKGDQSTLAKEMLALKGRVNEIERVLFDEIEEDKECEEP